MTMKIVKKKVGENINNKFSKLPNLKRSKRKKRGSIA